MAAMPYHVAESFVSRRFDKAGAFTSSGDAIYSYALKLAHWQDGKIVIDVDLSNPCSVTTARHMRALRYVLDDSSFDPLEIRVE